MPPNHTDDSRNNQKTKKNKPPMFHNISPNSFRIYIHYRMSQPFSNYFTPSNKYAPLRAIVGAVPVRAARREQSANPQKNSTSLVQDLCKLDLSSFTFLFHFFIYRIHNFRYISEKRLNALFLNRLKFCICMFTVILMRNPIPPIKQFFQNPF